MKNGFLILSFLLVSFLCFGQKDTNRKIDATKIEVVDINLDEVYRIQISTMPGQEIKISTHSEGEYYNNIALKTEREGSVFHIFSNYPEKLTGGYDKLSAHKVFSLEVHIEIPENKKVRITSNLASVTGGGDFKFFYADLKQGFCDLKNFSGAATINTFGGNISMEVRRGIIEAESRNGDVILPDYLPNGKLIKLTSVDGTISVLKN